MAIEASPLHLILGSPFHVQAKVPDCAFSYTLWERICCFSYANNALKYPSLDVTHVTTAIFRFLLSIVYANSKFLFYFLVNVLNNWYNFYTTFIVSNSTLASYLLRLKYRVTVGRYNNNFRARNGFINFFLLLNFNKFSSAGLTLP